MWLQLHDGDGSLREHGQCRRFPLYEREKYTCLLTTAPVAEKLHRLYVRESAAEIMQMIKGESRPSPKIAAAS